MSRNFLSNLGEEFDKRVKDFAELAIGCKNFHNF